jgi:hypothetical protein
LEEGRRGNRREREGREERINIREDKDLII